MVATAIVLRDTGGPEVLRSENVTVGRPGARELRIRQTVLTVEPGKIFPLASTAAAQEELESRRASGPLLLVS